MNKITEKKQFSENVFMFRAEAPLIARSRKPGNFVIVRMHDRGERIPLTIADADVNRGTITLVVQKVGVSTAELCSLNVGDELRDIAGPLGTPTRIEKFGTVLCAGGGVGIAPLLPIVKALKQAGNRVLTVIAGRTADLVILEDEVRQYSDELIVMTDDGSRGEKGVVTIGMEKLIKQEHIDKAFAIGPPIMMKFCCKLTAGYNIPTEVSLNTIMVDGTGMCGACRLTIGGKTKFVCIDGPEFDGSLVDWDEMLCRMGTFREEEKLAYERYKQASISLKALNKGNKKEMQTDYSEQDALCSTDETQHSIAELTDRSAPWRQALRSKLKAKDRILIERVDVPELDPDYRVSHRREEVCIGITPKQAVREAQRCLDCANPSCRQGCPVSIDIPSFIKNLENGDVLSASRVLKDTSTLPAVCGRVCPQEKQCESRCIHNRTGHKPVAIGSLERYVADTAATLNNINFDYSQIERNNIKIGVVGSGPSGLTFAGEMAKKGYDVHVFEALHEIGGVLKYGIPEFRLPNSIVDREIDNLMRMGVTFHTNCIIGKTITIEELKKENYKGFFVGSGAGLPNFMNIPGENAKGIMSSNEYLTRVNLMDAASETTDTPIPKAKHVIVVGGGNTAMDSCRTARRLGAKVTLVYRRSEEEMPARLEEIRHAKEEGVHFLTLHNPIKYLTDESGSVTKAVLQVMQLGEPDESGRCRPEPIEGETLTIDTDMVIVAVGVSPNPLVPKSISGLELGRKNTIVVNESMKSSRCDLYAGGDIVRGGATVILAMGDGRKAAQSMLHEFNKSI